MGQVEIHARALWDYLRLGQQLVPADAICALGSDSKRVAERAADLWLQGFGRFLIVSGGQAHRSSTGQTEAEMYADIAKARGVPPERIIVENRASNTGENVLFVRELLEREGFGFQSFLLVQKPYMERRVLATFKRLWPDVECQVASPEVEFDSYARDASSRDRLVVHLMSAVLRIREYPKLGFQIAQDIPASIEDSYRVLLELGYRPEPIYLENYQRPRKPGRS